MIFFPWAATESCTLEALCRDHLLKDCSSPRRSTKLFDPDYCWGGNRLKAGVSCPRTEGERAGEQREQQAPAAQLSLPHSFQTLAERTIKYALNLPFPELLPLTRARTAGNQVKISPHRRPPSTLAKEQRSSPRVWRAAAALL